MKLKPCIYSQPNYLTSRTAIEALHAVRQSRTSSQILFAVCLSKKQALTGGKSLACEDKCSKKIGAVLVQQADRRSFEASAVPILVCFYILCNNKSYKEPSGFLRAEPLSSSFEDRRGCRGGKKLLSDKSVFPSLTTAPINDEAKKHNENLPGMGGIYNTVNLHVYHYAGNNPIKYTDPDGKWFFIDDLLVSIFAKLEGLQDEGIFQGMWMYFKASWMHPIDYGKAFIKFIKFIYEKYKVLKIPINNKLKFFIDWKKKRIGVKTPDIKETEMNIPEFKIFENNDKENMQ